MDQGNFPVCDEIAPGNHRLRLYSGILFKFCVFGREISIRTPQTNSQFIFDVVDVDSDFFWTLPTNFHARRLWQMSEIVKKKRSPVYTYEEMIISLFDARCVFECMRVRALSIV